MFIAAKLSNCPSLCAYMVSVRAMVLARVRCSLLTVSLSCFPSSPGPLPLAIPAASMRDISASMLAVTPSNWLYARVDNSFIFDSASGLLNAISKKAALPPSMNDQSLAAVVDMPVVSW